MVMRESSIEGRMVRPGCVFFHISLRHLREVELMNAFVLDTLVYLMGLLAAILGIAEFEASWRSRCNQYPSDSFPRATSLQFSIFLQSSDVIDG